MLSVPAVEKIEKENEGIVPLSDRTSFYGCTCWRSSVWKVFPGELPVTHRWNTDELLSKSYPPRPLLFNREFIGVQRWFPGKKSGLKGFPVKHQWKCRWSFGYCALPQRTLPVELLACWRHIRGWMIFIGVHRRSVWKGGGEIHRCFTSGILPVDSSGVQRVQTGKVGLKGA